MAYQLTDENSLLPEHNVARYCGPRKIINGTVAYDVFLLRVGEGFLSTNWLEYFHPMDRQFQVVAVQDALASKGFRVSRNGWFAVLNVDTAVQGVYKRLRCAVEFQTLGPGCRSVAYGDIRLCYQRYGCSGIFGTSCPGNSPCGVRGNQTIRIERIERIEVDQT